MEWEDVWKVLLALAAIFGGGLLDGISKKIKARKSREQPHVPLVSTPSSPSQHISSSSEHYTNPEEVTKVVPPVQEADTKEPEIRKHQPIDWRKAIITSEILAPKFKEI